MQILTDQNSLAKIRFYSCYPCIYLEFLHHRQEELVVKLYLRS